MTHTLVLTAAGYSSRMEITGKKEYLPLSDNGERTISVLSSSLHAFLETRLFSLVMITVPPGGESHARRVIDADTRIAPLLDEASCRLLFTEGGSTRQDSVRHGLESLFLHSTIGRGSPATVLIHDAARPWVSKELINAVLSATLEHGAAVPALPAIDTQKEIDDTGCIIRHLDRSRIVSVQTPQGFLFQELLEAHRLAAQDSIRCTDDAEIWGLYVGNVFTCPGERINKKITYREDII